MTLGLEKVHLQALAKSLTELSACLCSSNIQEMRKVHKDAFLKKHNIKLGFMSAFVKAAAYALTDQPAVNAGVTTSHKSPVTVSCVFTELTAAVL